MSESGNEKLEAIKSYLRDEFEMDDDDVNEMLGVFFESMSELLDTANAQLASSDAGGLAETGHAIKGAAANLNATEISEIGLEMEMAGKNGDSAKCAECATKLAEKLAELKTGF